MITKAYLNQLSKERKAKQLQEERKETEREKKLKTLKQKRDCDRAKSLLQGELGEALMQWNKYYTKVKIGEADWETLNGYTSRWPHFELGFDPDPKYRATKILMATLVKAGFDVKIVKENAYHKILISWE